MLAQNFKTAADLGIKDAEFEALIKVLGMLERGELQHTETYLPMPNGFNMAEILAESDCGTAACICGWAYKVSGEQAFARQILNYQKHSLRAGWSKLPRQLRGLFFPNEFRFALGPVTPERAAIALRSYLTTGKAAWAEALA